MRRFCLLLFSALLFLLTGCAQKQKQATVPAPPDLPQQAESSPPPDVPSKSQDQLPLPNSGSDKPPLLTEMGIASWYGPPYHNRRGSNGEVYDMNQMTAAHRTLPLNSLVRVTNMKTGHSAIVRITDRGPFIGERMLDLSMAAAKATDVWGPGLAWVKMEVLQTPVPIDEGGKWAVQIGAFNTTSAAIQMKQHLIAAYPSAKVLEFPGPTGDWVRIRVEHDDRAMAEQISRSVTTPEGGVFLVRLD